MAKKKLTKTQVKRMLTNRMQYPTTHNVPLSLPKIIEVNKVLDNAARRIK